MGVLSNKIERDELKPGDHIYSWRAAYVYAHHGMLSRFSLLHSLLSSKRRENRCCGVVERHISRIYVGDGMVIHYTRAAGQEIGTGTFLDRIIFSSSPSNANTTCERCGDHSGQQGVIISCLDCFLDGGNLYIFNYSVSPAFFFAKARGGTCTLAASDPSDVVIHRAKYLLDNGFGTYCLFKNNCEDFAIYSKTGLLVESTISVGRSGQLASLTAAVSALASSPLRFLTTSASGLALVTSGMYCIGRYVSDIGIRRDVVKIPVESLVMQVRMEEPEAAAAAGAAAAAAAAAAAGEAVERS